MARYYILEGHTPKPVDDILEWAQWFESADRHVKQTVIGEVRISTVFLGKDHSYNGRHPVLFETMIFGGEYDQYCDRYRTWAGAEHGHERCCKMVLESENQN